jgi:predicted transcriptional regulator
MTDAAPLPPAIRLAADIVAAYISNNSVPTADLSALINSVYSALTQVAKGQAEEPNVELAPAVPIKKSITPDFIICLEDGKKFKSLKRHLRTMYDMTPEQYRAKWSLPRDYPMVAPNYAKARSELAKTMGLGQQRKGAAKAASPSAKVPAPTKGRRAKKAA